MFQKFVLIKNGILFSLILLCGSGSSSFALILEAPSLEVIEKEMNKLDQGSLVVFDVDDTLITSADQILQPCGNTFIEKYLRKNASQLSPEKKNHLISIVLQQRKAQFVDKKILILLQQLQEKNIKVIALTALESGPLGLIPSLAEWRAQELQSLGIHFQKSFPNLISLPLQPKALFYQGVIFSEKYPKGEVLNFFLEKLTWTPTKILFIDDRLSYCESVDAELEKKQIDHLSFHYTAASSSGPLDEDLAAFQLQYLQQNERWLSDDEGRKMLHASDEKTKIGRSL